MANASTWATRAYENSLKQRINQNPEPLVTEEEIKKEANTARAGGYGMVIRDIFTPSDKILKFFYRSIDLKKVILNSLKIKDNMGPNEGHTMKEFNIPITFSMLQDSYSPIARKYRSICLTKGVDPSKTPNDPLPILILVDNGIDLFEIDIFDDEEGRRRPPCKYRCPVLPLLQQFLKLLSQTRQLYYRNKIHCDIRDSNVMINIDRNVLTNPEIKIDHPRLTIIDFDVLTEKETFKTKAKTNLKDNMSCDITSFCFYNKPIEGLFLSIIGNDVTLSKKNKHRNMSRVINELYWYYLPIFCMIYPDISYNTSYEGFIPIFRSKIQKGIDSTMNFNLQKLVDTSDNYGLGFCLLKILALFYFDKQEQVFTNVMDYENRALKDTVELLKKMISFNQDTRISPVNAYTVMEKICENLSNQRVEPMPHLSSIQDPTVISNQASLRIPFQFSRNKSNIKDPIFLYQYLTVVKDKPIFKTSKQIQEKYGMYSSYEDNINLPNSFSSFDEDVQLGMIRESATALKKAIKDKISDDNPDYQKCSDVYRDVFGQPKNSKIVAFFAGRLDNAQEKKPPIKRAFLAYEYMRYIANQHSIPSTSIVGGKRRTMRRKRLSCRSKSLKRRRPL